MNDTQQVLCKIINQLFQIKEKVNASDDSNGMQRKFDRIHTYLEELNLHVHNPIGESYDDTRLDCEATISGDSINNLEIVEVIKPIIYLKSDGNTLLQRGVVIVKGK